MEDIYNELEEISSKGNYKQFVKDYWEQQETADRIIADAIGENDAARREYGISMKELSNLFIRAINYKYTIRCKHVDVSKQMIEKDFGPTGEDVGETRPEIESSAMLLVGRAWLRSKLTYLEVSGPLWARICSIIRLQIPIDNDADADADESRDEMIGGPKDEDEVLPELKALASSIYRYIGTYGSGLSLDLELRTQEELLRELQETKDNDLLGEHKVPERLLSEFDDVIDDAFDYDRFRSKPLSNTLRRSLVSGNKNDDTTRSLLNNLVPLANKNVVERWLHEYVDSSLLEHIDDEMRNSKTVGGRIGGPTIDAEGCLGAEVNRDDDGAEPVDLRDIEKSRKLYLSAMGIPYEDGCDADQE